MIPIIEDINENSESVDDELRRLRAAVENSNLRADFFADQLSDVLSENEALRERLITNQNQMRIMRHSVVWRAGGVFRKSKRLAGVVVRNVIGMIRT